MTLHIDYLFLLEMENVFGVLLAKSTVLIFSLTLSFGYPGAYEPIRRVVEGGRYHCAPPLEPEPSSTFIKQ